MEVILLERVRNLGNLGDKVNVKPGYGRNFLLPKGHAIRATKSNIEKFEARRAELEAKEKANLDAAQARADVIVKLGDVTITAAAGEEGKLFGSVGPREIADAINAAGADVEKREVAMPEGPLRETGEFDLQVQLHSDVVVNVKIVIAAEE